MSQTAHAMFSRKTNPAHHQTLDIFGNCVTLSERSACPDDEAKLLEGGHAIVETDLFNDLAILELQ